MIDYHEQWKYSQEEVKRLTKENEQLKEEMEYLNSAEGRSAEKLCACIKCITAVAKAESERDRFELALKQIVSNDMRSHFNRVDAMQLSQWAREALNK